MTIWRSRWTGALTSCAVEIALAAFLVQVGPARTKSHRDAIEPKPRQLTVADAIEATHVLHPYGSGPVLISPNGKKYLVVLQQGDVARNGSWVELLSGSTDSVDAAARADVVARLFSKSTAQADELAENVRWFEDNEHVVLLWDDGQHSRKVLSIDVRTHRMRTLARCSMPIVQYDVSLDGRTIVFVTQARHDLTRLSTLEQHGFAVTNQSIWSLLEGNLDGWTPWLHYETFASSRSENLPRKIREPERDWATTPELLRISPDGRYAIAVRPVSKVPVEWDKYTQQLFRDDYLPPARQHPDGPNWIRQYVIIDIKNAISKPLWNAPENPRGQVIWSPDSRSLLVGPTFLPAEQSDAVGLSGRAVAQVDVASGRFIEVPLPSDIPEYGYRPVRWHEGNIIELVNAAFSKGNEARLVFKRVGQNWKPIEEQSNNEQRTPQVRIELRQDPNTRPALYAVDTSRGIEKLIRDLDPQLKDVTLGRVELVHWKATDGRPWTGMLYYPVHYQPGQRFPLVIQTHGYRPDEFSLDGAFTTADAAQPLANRDIVVLQVGGPDGGDKDIIATPLETNVYMAGFEGALQHFATVGLVNPEKVGIIGFSRSGWLVEYMLTHSQYAFAAAEIADNIDGSYFQYVLAGNDIRAFYEADKGTSPFGSGLKVWMRESPGFNADKIRTPLRLELDSGPISEILIQWEMFSNLRYLGKPVELFIIPNIQQGVHILQNPAQRLASQGGTVDWFCFWLKGEEDTDSTKIQQYLRWRKLRALEEKQAMHSKESE